MQRIDTQGLSELMNTRHKPTNRANFSPNIGQPVSQQAINKLLESNLTKAGFDLDKFGELIQQSNTEARQFMADRVAEANNQAPAVLETLHRTLENMNDRLERLKTLSLPDSPVQLFFLDTAQKISTSGFEGQPTGITLDSTHVGPNPENNWAKFRQDARGGPVSFGDHSGFSRVSFGFLWQNPTDRFAVVNVSGFIVLNGFCSVFSDSGFFPGRRNSHLDVETDLFIHELWNEPPTVPTEQPTQNKITLVVDCDSGGFIAAGGANDESLVRDFWLYYDQLLMPPNGMVLFEVACSFYSSMAEGQTQSDFAFGGRQLVCPGVLVALQP